MHIRTEIDWRNWRHVLVVAVSPVLLWAVALLIVTIGGAASGLYEAIPWPYWSSWQWAVFAVLLLIAGTLRRISSKLR